MTPSTPAPPRSTLLRYTLTIAALWTVAIIGLYLWNMRTVHVQTEELMLHTAKSVFHEIVTARLWNASHGGVYVPVTASALPNPYLHVPDRDVRTTDGLLLTKINPAYMTRQISELGRKQNAIWYHITSSRPIRPDNSPDPWETVALAQFEAGLKETSSLCNQPDGTQTFRYMSPLWVEKPCLKCHENQGYKEGDLRGGISVTVKAEPYLATRQRSVIDMSLTFGLILITGLVGIGYATDRLRKDERQREQMIRELSDALDNVKTLSGLLPICASCKKVRDDKGYWSQIEGYIQKHSDATFSHGICPDCVKKLYPGIAEKIASRKESS